MTSKLLGYPLQLQKGVFGKDLVKSQIISEEETSRKRVLTTPIVCKRVRTKRMPLKINFTKTKLYAGEMFFLT